MQRTTAVFHDQERVDSAVRELTHEGIDEEDILIEPALRKKVRAAYPTAVAFAGLGAGFGLISGIAIGGFGGNALAALWLVLVLSGAFALISALLGAVLDALRREHKVQKIGRDWIVSVDADDPAHVRDVLRSVGGELLPAG